MKRRSPICLSQREVEWLRMQKIEEDDRKIKHLMYMHDHFLLPKRFTGAYEEYILTGSGDNLQKYINEVQDEQAGS